MFESPVKERHLKIEGSMLFALLGLMMIGVAFIYSATSSTDAFSQAAWFQKRFVKQIFFYILGTGAGIGLCTVDYHKWARWSSLAYWLTIALLGAVLVLGSERYGGRRWIDLGFFQFQPSEFAKVTFIFFMANFLSRPPEELRDPNLFWKSIAFTVIPFGLIFREPDLGSALVLLPVGLLLMWVAGVPLKYLGRFVGALALILGLLVVDILFAPPRWQIKLEEYQRQRLLVYFNQDFASPSASPAQRRRAQELQRERSYNIEQALISVGSGGLTGKGWCQGTQNALGFLPRAVAHNDFIFSVIAEEKGFLGSVVVISLYAVILLAGLKIASQARDRLGTLLAVGVVSLLFSHVFINIGMNIRLMPVTGIPLPLLSYGGSSVVCSLIAVGILQNVYWYRRNY